MVSRGAKGQRGRGERLTVGGDRTLIGFGASYKPSKSLNFDIGYTHVFVNDSDINQSSTTAGALKGNFEGSVDIVGLQFGWEF
ncbi:MULTISPECIES: outer membrane protein transport protein [Nostoc]|uniref:Outer membrane protein transport protein n=1 Tax=Nostoc paludosum FACHB-159 TaxID=2692908 RepID=A0ABR8KDV7_9NOSO|nr:MULTISPECIES: outer membrane protein transport protein [Nostoc]MBD2681257.1 outer membrane protein transport protein [Nostoc sp. FACHB-857]MBD2737735.1 outer membrane protein transport protein [Nostoc paludosum FACHB-159]